MGMSSHWRMSQANALIYGVLCSYMRGVLVCFIVALPGLSDDMTISWRGWCCRRC